MFAFLSFNLDLSSCPVPNINKKISNIEEKNIEEKDENNDINNSIHG